MITELQAVEAARTLLKYRQQEGSTQGVVPASVTAALDKIDLPDDVIARGPVRPLTDEEVDHNLAQLAKAGAEVSTAVGWGKKALAIFGL